MTFKQPSLQTIFTILGLEETEKQFQVACEPNPIKRRKKKGLLLLLPLIIINIICIILIIIIIIKFMIHFLLSFIHFSLVNGCFILTKIIFSSATIMIKN